MDRPATEQEGRKRASNAGFAPIDPSAVVGSWVEDALCRDMSDLFFSPLGPDWTDAKKVCEDCPVRRTCLEYALKNKEVHGTWGGQNQLELRFLLAVDAAERPKRYPGILRCPWCHRSQVDLTAPPPRSGLPESCSCRNCGFSWERVYVPRRGRRKSTTT